MDSLNVGAALGIEVDGVSDDMGDDPLRDERRDGWPAGRGVMTLRLTAADVLGEMEAVVGLVVHTCRERIP